MNRKNILFPSLITLALLSILAYFYLQPNAIEICPDLRQVITHSESSFSEIQGPSGQTFRGYETSFMLPDADACTILEDPEKSTYQCSWQFPLGDPQATTVYEGLYEDIRACIGHLAEEEGDQPVNHPDTYLSSLFKLPQGQLNISLKNKSELSSTLIFVRLDDSGQGH